MQRLDQYIAYSGLNDNRLTVQAGLKVGIINSARKRNKGIGSENIEKILLVRKDLNARWLLTGEGEMLAEDSSQAEPNLVEYLKKQNSELNEKIKQLNQEIKQLNQEISQLNRELGKKEGQIQEMKKRIYPCRDGCRKCRCKTIRFGEIEYVIPKY